MHFGGNVRPFLAKDRDRTRLKNQIDRLFNADIDLVYEDGDVKASTGGRLASKTVLWWNYHNPDQQTLSITPLSQLSFNHLQVTSKQGRVKTE